MADLDLRPLSLGEILDRTFSLYRRHFVLFVGIAAIPQLLILAMHLGQVLLTGGGMFKTASGGVMALGVVGVLIGIIVYLVAYLFAQGGTVYAVSKLYLGRNATISESLLRMRGEVGNLFGVMFLNGLAVVGGLIFLIIPGFYVACRLITCIPAALLENLGARESLERSFRLTKDNAGRAFVIYLLYSVVLYAAVFLFAFPFLFAVAMSAKDPAMVRVWISFGQVGNFLAAILVTPIFTIATAVFYYDLRVRKEAFDLHLMMDPSGNVAPPSGELEAYFRDLPSRALQRLRMKYRILPVLILACIPIYTAARGRSQTMAVVDSREPVSVYNTASFGVELNRLAVQLQHKRSANEIAQFRKSLPQSWTVSTPQRTFSISTEPLQDQLGTVTPSIEKSKLWIEHLKTEIKSSQPGIFNSVAARTELDRILAGSEFASVRPPGAMDLFRQRVSAWLERTLSKLFGGIGRHPIGAEVLFWLFLVAGVATIALWLFRFMSRRDGMNSLNPPSTIVTAWTWQEWMRSARQAANRGDFREAVHSAYWAGIARLEDLDAVPRDRTKTPREYLYLVSGMHSRKDATIKEPLSALTSRLERIWYANRGASSEDFRDSLHQLETLGCILE